MHVGLHVPRAIAVGAARWLADVDFTVANRVSDDVAGIVKWGFDHDSAWVAHAAIGSLRFLDDLGSVLIAIVVWIVQGAQ
jgi:hypothetical protein